MNTPDKILGYLEDASLFAAALKCLFFDTEILWCGKVYLGGQTSVSRPGAFERIGEYAPPAEGR